ncbi:hypothetical protein CC78DRAFT_536964 [Lojkania enalia]|uniref:Uncharacterized protein n=1 Tax=Lojkania enalia TaxID=147567 RepID=A0A9P4K3R1_9PLEO|nr:hypothetical protein CC78DRAFT_536964 [Didymosphaeria enalia]
MSLLHTTPQHLISIHNPNPHHNLPISNGKSTYSQLTTPSLRSHKKTHKSPTITPTSRT